LQRWRDIGSARAKLSGGSTSPLVAEQPDLTLDEIVAAMRKQRIPGSRTAVWRFFERNNVTVKKSLRATEQERADVARARRRWIRKQGLLDPARLVFIDETDTSTSLVRPRGRCPRGRTIGRVGPPQTLEDYHPGCRTAPRPDGRTLRDRWADERDDLPRIRRTMSGSDARPRDVVIMDNLPAHKVAGVTDAIEAVAATAFYLPPYSTDLNPIEQVFSKLKALLRKTAERTVPKLWRRIHALLRNISDEKCLNFFPHAGYASI
jgi:transposase